ncbi:MAG: type II toxin-antitoxin system PemK/MazF family toxin [Patescibacteria group bacterium]|nr:type II toxin-antitoxin system PemK/MazF family toxin [Patescibacteria group bacterium]
MEKIIELPRRGDIYLVNFDPTIGREIKKTRPAVIIQNNISNEYSSVVIVAAVTSYRANYKIYPTEVIVPCKESGLNHDSLVLLNQIRTIDKQRLLLKVGKVNSEILLKIDKALEISLGIVL